jgi:hypothetical protein
MLSYCDSYLLLFSFCPSSQFCSSTHVSNFLPALLSKIFSRSLKILLFFNPLHSFIMTVQYSHFCRLRYFFLLVPSPSYPLSCVPLCASFPDPTFFIHLPFSLFFFHFRRHLFLHLIFLPLLKNLYIISNGSRVKYRFFNETLQAHFCEKDGIGQKR